MVDDKLANFKSGFCIRLFSAINKEFGNTLTSLLSMAGADYAGELNIKYSNKDVDFKMKKFVDVMREYNVNINASHYNKNGNDVVELVCDNCVFDLLNVKELSFCSYSESFFKKYFQARKIEKIKRENENSKCTYLITL